jgi:hypothetical protein
VGNFALRVVHRLQEGFNPLETQGDVPAPVQLGSNFGKSTVRCVAVNAQYNDGLLVYN